MRGEGQAPWCGLCILFIFHLASGVAPRQRCSAPPCSPFNHNGHLCKHKANVPSGVGQGSSVPNVPASQAMHPVGPPLSLFLPHRLAAVLRLEHENIYMHRHATGVAMRSTEVAMQASKEASSDGNGGKSKQSGECQMPATSATPTLLKKGASWANQRANRAQITNWNSRWGTANGRHTHHTKHIAAAGTERRRGE